MKKNLWRTSIIALSIAAVLLCFGACPTDAGDGGGGGGGGGPSGGTYAIDTSSQVSNGGSVTASPDRAAAGAQVTLTVTPNTADGFNLVADSLKVNNDAVTVTPSSNVGQYTFLMPAQAVTVSARFEVGVTVTDWSTLPIGQNFWVPAVEGTGYWATGGDQQRQAANGPNGEDTLMWVFGDGPKDPDPRWQASAFGFNRSQIPAANLDLSNCTEFFFQFKVNKVPACDVTLMVNGETVKLNAQIDAVDTWCEIVIPFADIPGFNKSFKEYMFTGFENDEAGASYTANITPIRAR